MRFVLVHHGDVAPDTPVTSGDGPALSPSGRLQARAVASELRALASRGERLEAVYTTTEHPAREAASIITEALSLPSATTLAELSAAGMVSDPGATDSVARLQERAWSAVESLRGSQEPDATLVFVAGEMAVRVLVCRALGMPLEDMRRFALDPGSMTTIEFRTQPRERTLIASLNETCHLEQPAPGYEPDPSIR